MDLPRNLNGDPEYASITMKFDAIFAETGDLPVRYSTDAPEVALAKVFRYYSEEALSRRADILDLVHKGAASESVYVYAPSTHDQTLNVIMGTGTYRTLIDHPKFGNGARLVADQKLAEVIAHAFETAREARGGTPPLLLIEAETAVLVGASTQEAQSENA